MVYAGVTIWEYCTVGYWSWMYVIGFPTFLIWMWSDDWNIHDVNYDDYLAKVGLNFIVYGTMKDWGDCIKYHYLIAMKDNKTLNKGGLWFMKTLLMFAVNIGDILTLMTTPFLLTIFWPFTIIWIITAIVMDILMVIPSIGLGDELRLEFYATILKFLGYDNIIIK